MDRDREAEPLRIVVADGDALLRKALATTLQEEGITVVAEAGTGDEAVELARFYHPHVVLVGDRLAGVGMVKSVRALLEAEPAVRVVILTASPDDEEALAAVRMGAAGYLSKDIELESLPRILRGVAYGEAAFSRRLAMSLAEFYRRGPRGGAGLRPVRSTLTDREWEVLDLLASGARTEEIARTLVLSTETVRSHLKNLYRKLGVRSRSEATEAAERLRELIG
jgi:DNA-binding NarL/FixJ family response regulator